MKIFTYMSNSNVRLYYQRLACNIKTQIYIISLTHPSTNLLNISSFGIVLKIFAVFSL